MKIAIHNGHLFDPSTGQDGIESLFIVDGSIVAIGVEPEGFSSDQEIDASGKIVCPGLIDLSARLREPGQEHKATILSETHAAAAAGITSLCCPPDTDPVIDTPAVSQLIQHSAETIGASRVFPIGALSQRLEHKQLSEMAALQQAGCVGVANVTPIQSTQFLRQALEYATTFDLTVFLTPKDYWLAKNGCAHEGTVATRLGLPGIPEAAETAAVARDLAVAEQTGARIHFCRLSTARGAQMVAQAQQHGLPVSADVAIHQLFLTEKDIDSFDSRCHVSPPLRTEEDRQELCLAVEKGIIQGICSDHQPHEPDAKLAPFIATEAGISGLDTLLGLSLKLVDQGTLTLHQAIARLTCGPAAILGVNLGRLEVDQSGDMFVFDPDHRWKVSNESLNSNGHNTPFMGWELRGIVSHTLVRGKVVYQGAG